MNGPIKPDGFTRFEIARTDFPSWGAWITSNLAKLWSRLLREHESRRVREALAALDDRTLKDIGISRHEIDDIGIYERHWH
jgi:uncharacterized protein YjiS (DUF1127 family)